MPFTAETELLMHLNNLFYLSNVSILLVGGRLNNFKIQVALPAAGPLIGEFNDCGSVSGK